MKKKWVTLVSAVLFFITSICNAFPVSAKEDVKITNEEYEVFLCGAGDSFLCNKNSLSGKSGTECFLTYTVESANACGLQNGLIGTSAPEESYPYTKGQGMLFFEQRKKDDNVFPLLMTGYTYFIKFVALDSGFRYTAARAKNDSSEYFVVETKMVDSKADFDCNYFGLWFALGRTTAHLTHVRFYDKAGNDLGIWSPRAEAAVKRAGIIPKDTSVNHKYVIKAKKLANLAISNEKPLTTKKMYIEYTVKSSTSTCRQTGVAYSNSPEAGYPHGKGLLRYEGKDKDVDCFLLEEGADYLIVLEQGPYGFTALVQITKNGKTTISGFPTIVGTHDPESQFFSLWFGEGGNWRADFTLENVKFYDENKNNLGVQSNNSNLSIRHIGEMSDYSGCEAFYYCKEDNTYYSLFENANFEYFENGLKSTGTYKISEGVITLKSKSKTEKCDYLYRYFKDRNGKTYKRLNTYNVNFVTGSDSVIAPQILSAKNGYLVKVPEMPTLKNCTFEGWVTSDGKDFDFNGIVTGSKTLYAKWSNGAGIEFIAQKENLQSTKKDYLPYFAIVLSVIILAATVVGSVLILKGGKLRR